MQKHHIFITVIELSTFVCGLLQGLMLKTVDSGISVLCDFEKMRLDIIELKAKEKQREERKVKLKSYLGITCFSLDCFDFFFIDHSRSGQ